jgi:hypothetical protein
VRVTFVGGARGGRVGKCAGDVEVGVGCWRSEMTGLLDDGGLVWVRGLVWFGLACLCATARARERRRIRGVGFGIVGVDA